jgi:hypothetical protein
MESRILISSIQSLDLQVRADGVVINPVRPELWYALIDDDRLVLANCLRDSGISELDIEDIESIGFVDADLMLSIQLGGEWDYLHPALISMNPPPARDSTEEYVIVPDEPDVLDLDELNKLRRAGLREFMRLFPMIFPDAEDRIYYDLLKERIMIDMGVFGRPEQGLQCITDDILAVYHLHVEEALFNLGVKTQFSWTVMDEALKVWGRDHRRNQFLDWVESLKWDGKPRMATMFRDLLGGRAPALSEEEEARYLESVARAWLTGAIARCYKPTKHEIVPVFISKQGMGKGTALNYLAGRDEWFQDVAISPKQTDKFLDAVRGRIIVELSEATALRADVEALKAFITQREDQMRKAYGHFEQVYPRHFIMAASTNNPSIFTDVTGNRRFFPMFCDPKRATINGSQAHEYVEQLWAEVFQAYHRGARVYMTPEEQDLAEPMQDYASVENGNVIAIDDYLDDPLNGLTDKGSKVSRAYIMERVFGYTGNLIPKDLETAYRAWALGTKRWEKATGTIRVDGRPSRGYIRIYEPGEIPRAERLPITIEEAPGTLEEEFRKLTASKEIGDILYFDRFRADGMSQEIAIQTLLDEGYIYCVRNRGLDEYHLGDKP